MSAEYALRADRDAIDVNIHLGYARAQENFGHAVDLARDTPWLWGAAASFEDYQDTDPLSHQLSGELPIGMGNYRTSEYNRCNDAITKELSANFKEDVYEQGGLYLREALDDSLSREERIVRLDYAKQYLLTMFHAVQYPLRRGEISEERMAALNQLGHAARSATRAFYLDVLGHDSSWINQELLAAQESYDQPQVRESVVTANTAHFKSQEMDQPLTILASSLLATDEYPDTDLIYGLPAGGTQHAIVTQLLFELKNGADHAPAIDYLPISTHSSAADKTQPTGKISAGVDIALRQSNPRGKHVLICEDNSNTGTTLSLAADVVNALGPASLHISMTEFDPLRMRVKYNYPQPEVQIANYAHPDFTTAVGIVPVTIGRYPDVQLRKVSTLRRAAAALAIDSVEYSPEITEYDAIPSEFLDVFTQAYRDTLRYCGDTYGYRSPYLVSAALIRHFTERGMLRFEDTDHEMRAVTELARVATTYPYLPEDVKAKLTAHEESLDYEQNGPWIRQGAQALIREFVSYADEFGGNVTIWTKGDGTTAANPPHVGLNEQSQRFTLSGLGASLREIGFDDAASSRDTFVAHPKKTHLLKTRILPDLDRNFPGVTDVVIIDDTSKNLAEAAQYVRLFGYRPHVLNPLDTQTMRTNLDEIRQMAVGRIWGEHAAFIVDMDDTLLHEQFRKYHQPRNMALALIGLHPEILDRI